MYEHWLDAKKVVVIGAGTMGSGIAAHLANIGFEVSLLDLTRESCEAAFAKARAIKPPHFFVDERAKSVRLGGIDNDLDWVREADWICEAIVEKLDLKQALFERLDGMIPDGAMISTNTSGLQISLLSVGRSESFRKRFLGTHFFNPPRYLKLLELIPTPDTSADAIAQFTAFLESRAARRVVVAKDTPGFIANRYGMWSMFKATHVAERLRLTPEQVDAITGPFLGRPRSGSFRLNDLVGLDIMQDIARNLIERCPEDPRRFDLENPRSVNFLTERGWIGEKAKQGYYRKEGRELLTFDLEQHAYRQRVEPSVPSIEKFGKLPLGERIAATLKERDEAGEYLREYLVPALQYADALKEEISHSVLDFDRVMMWGFGWQMGPFAMIDAIGPESLGMNSPAYFSAGKQLDFAGSYVDLPTEPDYAPLTSFPVIGGTDTYNLRDLGEGVTAVCAKTKMGVISPALVEDLHALLDGPIDGFVLCSEAKVYSVGFDLTFFDQKAEAGDRAAIELAIQRLHELGEKLERKRCVAAVNGYALGAGLELALSCAKIVALSDTNIGLPEAKVGLIPGGRGTVLARLNNQSNAKRLTEVAVNMALGKTSSSADEARMLGWLRGTDVTEYHPDRLISAARRAVQGLVVAPRAAWASIEGPLSGQIDRELDQLLQKGEITEYDRTIGDKIRLVFAKAVSYDAAIELEKREFADLCAKALTHARIRHMLETGKPLRN